MEIDEGVLRKGEFSEIINSIVDKLHQKNDGVNSEEISQIIQKATGLSEFNCYPGYPSTMCHQTVFFISLNSKKIVSGGGHLHFRKIFDCLIEHMLLKCQGITTNAIIITDSWDARIASSKQSFIDKIERQANIELYIFTISPTLFITQMPITKRSVWRRTTLEVPSMVLV